MKEIEQKYTLLSWHPEWKETTLIYEIKKFDNNPDSSRTAIIKRAISASINSSVNWREIYQNLQNLEPIPGEFPPVSTQIRLTSEEKKQWDTLKESIISNDSAPDKDKRLIIKKLSTPFAIRLVLGNYLNELKFRASRDAIAVGTQKEENRDLSAPEMMKIFTELLLLDRVDEKKTSRYIDAIKKILIEWEEEHTDIGLVR